MSDGDMCPVHFSKRDANGNCIWCQVAKGEQLMKPYLLSENDRTFLHSIGVDPDK